MPRAISWLASRGPKLRPTPDDWRLSTAVTRFLIVRLARSATSCTPFRSRRRCAARFPPRASTGSSAPSIARFSISCRSIDRRLVINDRRRRVGRPVAAGARFASCAAARYDVAIDLQGLIKSALLARALRRAARDRLFVALRARALGAACSTPKPTIRAAAGIYDPRETRHVVEINLGLLEPLGITRGRAGVSDRTTSTRRSRAGRCAQTGGRYALLNPGRGVAEQALAADRVSARWPRRCASGTG